MSEPKISVIVPIYQIERYIGLCIESILNQTYKNLEIILVDDGSPDRCPEICDLYAGKDSRIKVIHKPNGGLVSARKAGLEIATGAYVGYVDGDDWVGPGFYESLYSAIATSGSDMVCAGQSRDLFTRSVHFLNPYPLGIYQGENLKVLQENMLSYGEFYRPGITTYVWNKLFRREVLYKHQMEVDERISIGEDAAVTYPVLMSCNRVYISDCAAYHYRQREDSMLKKSASFSAEAEKLRYLYEYMSGFADTYGGNLQKQVDDYVLGICIMRSGGRLPDDSYSTFDESYYGKDVVIYSAGTFGQQLMNRFKESGHCNVVAWIDDDCWEYRRCCLDVDPVERIVRTKFDYVLIAAIDGQVVDEVKNRLLDYGISEQKILSVSCPEKIRKELLRKYLYG
jgi:glycosyltransferase involved in cell wall biosynthesis